VVTRVIGPTATFALLDSFNSFIDAPMTVAAHRRQLNARTSPRIRANQLVANVSRRRIGGVCLAGNSQPAEWMFIEQMPERGRVRRLPAVPTLRLTAVLTGESEVIHVSVLLSWNSRRPENERQ